MRRLALFGSSAALMGVVALSSACADAPPADDPPVEAPPAVSVVEGSCGDVHGVSVCTWAKLEGERIVEVGANVPIASIANADPEAPFLWPPVEAATIALPEVVQQRYGILDLKIYWESHGHPPGPYLIPHFDYHFYVSPAAEVALIDCTDTSKPTTAPDGYALPDVDIPELGNLIGLCVPGMGMHALSAAELASEDPFEGSMVIGYYAGSPIFFEPMVPFDRLMLQETFSFDMPAVAGTEAGVVLPTRFEAVYDEAAAAYEFVFSGFPMG